MTADIPSWMKPAQRGRGLGEMHDQAPSSPSPEEPPTKLRPPARGPKAEQALPPLDEIEEAELVEPDPLAEPFSELPAAQDEQIGAEILAQILPKLRGVRSVTIRVYGKDQEAGPALQQLLRRRGLDVKLSTITQIVPPPISKLSVRYQGVDATITLAPDIGG